MSDFLDHFVLAIRCKALIYDDSNQTPGDPAAQDREMEITSNQIKALTDLCSFLVWLRDTKPRDMWGAVKIERAVQALSEISGLTVDQIERVARAGVHNG